MENKNIVSKAFFAGMVMAIMTSCGTVQHRKTRKHDRFVEKYPYVHQIDTFVYQLIDTIEIEGIKGVDTMYFDISRIDTIRDTFYLKDSTMVINTIWKRDGSNYALKTDIRQPNKTRIIIKKIPIPVIVKPNHFLDRLKWFTIGTCIGIVLAFVLTYLIVFRNRKK